jgi:hypothetical protein
MGFQLETEANLPDLAGVLRSEIDRYQHSQGTPLTADDYALLDSALTGASQLASPIIGRGVHVHISGETNPETGLGTLLLQLTGIPELIPNIISVERPLERLVYPEEESVSDENSTLDKASRSSIVPDAPGSREADGRTDSGALLATRAEALGIERDRSDAIQSQARRDEQLKLEEEARQKGAGWANERVRSDAQGVHIGLDDRSISGDLNGEPVDPVTAAVNEASGAYPIQERHAPVAAPADLSDLQTANPDATGQPIRSDDGGFQTVTPADMLPGAPEGVQPGEVPGEQRVGPGDRGETVEPQDAPVTSPLGTPEGAVVDESQLTVDQGDDLDSPDPAPVADTGIVDDGDDEDDPGEPTKAELQDRLRERDLPVSGTKAELVQRLRDNGVDIVGPNNGQ